MAWIFEGLIEVFMSLAGDVIEFCLGAFADFEIDIGYKAGTSIGELFSPSYYQHAEGLLDRVFPSASVFLPIFMYSAYILVFLIFGFKIMQSMMGPLSSAEHPVKLAVNFSFAMVGVTYSYTFFIIMEKIASYIYGLFKVKLDDLTGVGLPSIKTFMASPEQLFKNGAAPGIGSFAMLFIALVFFITLIIQFVRLIIEMFERYVMLGVLFYTCPLAFSALASDSTKKVFSSWLSMVMSQFILMMMNLFFLSMFYAGFIAVFAPADPSFIGAITNAADGVLETFTLGTFGLDRGYVFSSAADFMCKMFILIGWLTVGQKVDEHLRSLGLSVSQSGRGVGAALAAGFYSAGKAFKTGARAFKAGQSEAGKIAKGMRTAEFNDAKTATRQKTLDRFMGTSMADKGRLAPNMSEDGYKAGLKRNTDGRLSKEGAFMAANAPKMADGTPIAFSSKDAKAAMEHMSLHPDSITPGGDIPKTHELKDGKFTSYDQAGSPVREVGDFDRYKADGAYISHSTPVGTYIEPATSEHIEAAAGQMKDSAEAMFDGSGISWSLNKNEDGSLNGTMTGYDSDNRPVYQAALDQVAEFNPALGGTAHIGNEALEGVYLGESGFSYSVQDLNDTGSNIKFTEGFNNIKPASSSSLMPKSVAEQNESYIARTGESGMKRFVQEENIASKAYSDPCPYEDKYTRIGRSINNAAGSSGRKDIYENKEPGKSNLNKLKDKILGKK